MEFKGTKGKWRCIFTNRKARAIRNEGGILMTFWKPGLFTGQHERYEEENMETKANQILCANAPQLLEMLKKVKDGLDSIWQNDDKNIVFDKISTAEIEELIKQATTI